MVMRVSCANGESGSAGVQENSSTQGKKCLQGADGITEIIKTAVQETERREKTGYLGTTAHQKLCVNS